jgi:hypothetical protein
MKKKNVTIDDLATMVQKGFNGVDVKFEQVDKRFDAMDKRFDKIENLILTDHKKRLEKLETEVKELRELFAM